MTTTTAMATTVATTDPFTFPERTIGTQMKTTFALLLAGGALAATQAGAATPFAAPAAAHGMAIDSAAAPEVVLLAGSDSDEGGWLWLAEDDEDDDSSGEDDCDPVKDPSCAQGGNAAPAGKVAPPKNGLFTDGTAPVVKSN